MKTQIWPVIAHKDIPTTLANATIAAEVGCHGVLIVHPDGRDELLARALENIREKHTLKIGLQRIGVSADTALMKNIPSGWDATWAPRCGVGEAGTSPLSRRIREVLKTERNHLFFGGTDPLSTPSALAALQEDMVPTIVGAEGSPALEINKLIKVAQALPHKSLALGGLSPSEIAHYIEYAGYFIANVSITNDLGQFNEEELASTAHQLRMHDLRRETGFGLSECEWALAKAKNDPLLAEGYLRYKGTAVKIVANFGETSRAAYERYLTQSAENYANQKKIEQIELARQAEMAISPS